jgi:hypothetical protein
MTHLLNAAMMPQPGTYRMEAVEPTEFALLAKQARDAGNLQTYIGYGSTAEMLSELCGFPISTSRDQTVVKPGDVMLVARLRYRVANPAQKRGEWRPKKGDFEFFKVEVL